jgi:alkanesulfonate monooxygenase SsuD/methylene tetrahydromethanopterin reductase-like flavin-dependent oxidoreductase (luciferase family)
MTSVGVVLRPQLPPEETRGVVVGAEAAGVDPLGLWAAGFREGGPTTAAAALAWSSRIRVGIGLLPVPLRNPAVAAMEIATLERMFPGRVTVALGHGVQEWMAQVGAAVRSPMTLLREHTTAVRDLLRGETVDVSGRYVRLDRVALDWPPAQPPTLLIGATGPRTVALAGELTDGVLLTAEADAAAVRAARELVGDRLVATYTEVSPTQVHDRIAELTAAGADTVIVQGPDSAPDPRPLIEALSR